MGKILENRRLADGFWLMRVAHPNAARMGQFYMLRAWGSYPVLSRPISVFDADGQTLSFLYQVVGKGTQRFAQCRIGEEIDLQGPYGNGFPEVAEGLRVALVGGGVGAAPLFLAAKRLRAAPGTQADVYLGFRQEAILVAEYEQAASRVIVDAGGLITDQVDPAGYDRIFTCGPEAMMRALYEKCAAAGAADRLYVSMEHRMACGIGACLVCSCKTAHGNRKSCKDGPVFAAEEVFGL